MALTRADILGMSDLKVQAVTVPGWGEVFIRPMSGADRDRVESDIAKRRESNDMSGFRALMAVRSVCDETGALIFTDDDIAALNAKAASALDFIAERATEINAMSAADVEELEKN